MKAYEALNKLFSRYSIQQTEMCEFNCYLEAVIHNGMGDFSTYKGQGKDLKEALKIVIKEYSEDRGIEESKLYEFIGEEIE
jgi:hypothetical protein